MTQHMHRDLDQVKREVLLMGGLVEEALGAGRQALEQPGQDFVKSIKQIERTIDGKQLLIDDHILKLLALHQPVASDLRFTLAALKIVNDLERMGDLVCTIAQRVSELGEASDLQSQTQLQAMMLAAGKMVHLALDSFVQLNVQQARRVLGLDDQVDEYNRAHFVTLMARMQEDSDSVPAAVGLLSISRSVERIADLATNVAEDVIFVSTGEDIRHAKPSGRAPSSRR